MKRFDSMLVEKRGGIGYVFINHLAQNNQLGCKESNELADALEYIDADPDVRVVILAAKGDYFCSGGRIDGFPDGSVVAQKAYVDAVRRSNSAIHKMRKPIIAAVEGDALAGGVAYIDACDLAVVGESCRFGLPEIQRGYFPMIALGALQKSLPKKILLEMAFLGELVDASTMLKWNLVNRVVPKAKVMETADEMALQIASYNSMSCKFGRDCYYSTQTMNIDDAMRYGGSAIINMINTHDAKETAYAKRENRAPEYLGY